MGVGFYLTGRIGGDRADPEAWLARVRSWFEEHCGEPLEGVRLGRDREGNPTLFASLHPCAEDLEIIVPEHATVVATGKTSTVGPGYHIFACDLLGRLGVDLGIAWDEPDDEAGTGDETGYFHDGDRGAVEEEFLRWLRSIALVVAENIGQGYREMMISMPMGHRYPHHGPLVTPLGSRDLAWLDAVADDRRRGVDLFPWWSGGIDARFYLGRALCRMWKDVRWRTPLTEDEGDLLRDTHLDLCRAYGRDPSLPYPWREWREVIDHIEAFFGSVTMQGEDVEPEVNRRATESADGPRIGYRRLPVRVDLTGGWSVEVPGEMAEEWDEEGTWSGWDGRRTVWFTSYTFTKPDGSEPTAAESLEGSSLPEGERLERRGERVIGAAVFAPYEEEGRRLWRLSGRSAVAGGLGVCNVFVEDEGDRDWAASIWESLDHP